MSNIFALLILVIATVLPSIVRGETAAIPATPIQIGTSHRFACADYLAGKVFIVSPEGKVEWEYQTTRCNDLWVLPNGNLLFNNGHGVREVNRKKEVVFAYDSASEIYACQRLPNANTFIGECNAGRLLEVTANGEIAKELRLLREGTNGGHLYMRNARKLANGNYLVCHYGEEAVKEYDANGKILLTIPADGGPHSAVRLRDGNTLVACGDFKKKPARIFEADKTGAVIWEVKNGDLPGVDLFFMAGIQRLPNGNTVMCNWVGHGQLKKASHLIEVTPAKKVVWTFADHETMTTISSVQILDVPGNALKGEILH